MKKFASFATIIILIVATINIVKVRFPSIGTAFTNALATSEEYSTGKNSKLTGTPALKAEACISGSDAWGAEIVAYPGDTIDFQLEFQNNCSGQLNNVCVGTDFGGILQYDAESALVRSSVHPEGIAPSTGIDSEEGITIGSPLGFTDVDLRNHRGANAFIHFSCKVPNDCQSGQCVITFWAKADNWEALVTASISIHIQAT